MKTKLFIFLTVILIGLSLSIGCSPTRDYGNKLPPNLPTNIPIIQGNIEDSHSTNFETDNGYIVGIRTPLNYDETIQYFKDAFKDKGVSAEFQEATNMAGSTHKSTSIEAEIGADVILIEITSGDLSTYVHYAVHIGK
jgi:hypothetical protein